MPYIDASKQSDKDCVAASNAGSDTLPSRTPFSSNDLRPVFEIWWDAMIANDAEMSSTRMVQVCALADVACGVAMLTCQKPGVMGLEVNCRHTYKRSVFVCLWVVAIHTSMSEQSVA